MPCLVLGQCSVAADSWLSALVFSYVDECVAGNVTAPFFQMHHGTCVKELISAGYLWWGCLSFIGVRWCVGSLLCE